MAIKAVTATASAVVGRDDLESFFAVFCFDLSFENFLFSTRGGAIVDLKWLPNGKLSISQQRTEH